MANAIQRSKFYDYLALVNAGAVQKTSWWDYLPTEIQIYIIQLAIRQNHRDQLADVHQVMRHYWNICDCGPFHMLMEIIFCEEYRISCGIRAYLTHCCPKVLSRVTPPKSQPFYILPCVTQALKINHMRSKHTHKIGFPNKVYSKPW